MRRRWPPLWLIPLLLTACGKKGPLQPPIPHIPRPPEVVSLVQRGGEMLFVWRNPAAYIDGRPLDEIEAVEIWMWTEEKTPDQALTPVDEGTFRERAGKVGELTPDQMSKLSEDGGPEGPIFRWRRSFDHADIGARRHAFALRLRDPKGRTSEFSGIVTREPRAVSMPPQGLKAAVEPARIRLEWGAPENNIDSSTPPALQGYVVYRADGESPLRPLTPALVKETRFDDSGFEFGKSYRYTVRAAANLSPPFLESDDCEPVTVEARDVFPPAAPAGLTLIAGGDFVSLSWSAPRARDLAGYRIWRRRKGEKEFSPLTREPFPELSFLDRTAEKNVTYEYAVTALDLTGNESPRSKPAEAVIIGRRT